MPQLQVLNGPLQWTTIPVNGPRFVIGRRKKCHLVLDDGWVSREHTVIIEPAPGEFVVQDLDSENGSFLNGKRITEAPLVAQDILRIGRTEMRFVATPTDAPPVSRPPLEEEPVGAGMPIAATRTLRTPVSPMAGSGGDAVLDMTVRLSPVPEGQRRDLKERVRRLENLLLAKEEENARLGAENAVLKRGMVSVGLIDRKTGSLDMSRFRETGGQRRNHGLSSRTYRLTWNPLARLTFPLADGTGTLTVGDGPGSPGTVAMNLIGLGDHGSRIVEAFWRLGHRSAVVLDPGGAAATTRSLPIGARVDLQIPEQSSTMSPPAQAIQNVKGLLQGAFQERLATERDLDVVAFSSEDPVASSALATLVGVLEERDRREGEHTIPKAAIALLPSGNAKGLKPVRLLLEAGRLELTILVSGDRVPGVGNAPEPDRSRKIAASLAGVLDGLSRVTLLEAQAGDLNAELARKVIVRGRIATLGLAATRAIDDESLDAVVQHALGPGLLCDGVGATRARSAVIVVLVGERQLNENQELAVTLAERAASVCSRRLPQAKVNVGVYEDGEEGVRILAFLGGLSFPKEGDA